MEQTPATNYLRRDLITLIVLIVVMGVCVAGLWYAEHSSGWFSRTAAQLLDASTR